MSVIEPSPGEIAQAALEEPIPTAPKKISSNVFLDFVRVS